YIISSTKSPSNIALIYERTLKSRTKTTLLGSLIFELQLKIKAVDQKQILRDSYQELAAVEYHLPHENSVSNE
ncbi:5194_t:CDS:2, partial [Funneliformis mosseae]